MWILSAMANIASHIALDRNLSNGGRLIILDRLFTKEQLDALLGLMQSRRVTWLFTGLEQAEIRELDLLLPSPGCWAHCWENQQLFLWDLHWWPDFNRAFRWYQPYSMTLGQQLVCWAIPGCFSLFQDESMACSVLVDRSSRTLSVGCALYCTIYAGH